MPSNRDLLYRNLLRAQVLALSLLRQQVDADRTGRRAPGLATHAAEGRRLMAEMRASASPPVDCL